MPLDQLERWKVWAENSGTPPATRTWLNRCCCTTVVNLQLTRTVGPLTRPTIRQINQNTAAIFIFSLLVVCFSLLLLPFLTHCWQLSLSATQQLKLPPLRKPGVLGNNLKYCHIIVIVIIIWLQYVDYEQQQEWNAWENVQDLPWLSQRNLEENSTSRNGTEAS